MKASQLAQSSKLTVCRMTSITVSWPEGHVPLLQTALLTWYDSHRRKLPWRGDSAPVATPATGTAAAQSQADPSTAETTASSSGSAAPLDGAYHNAYGTWVSEVMLQQTRVETVVPYWLTWMGKWPTVTDLAGASEEEVNTAWAGLGFYRRARNLHKGARAVVERYGGEVPRTVAGLKEIAGIGDYTAGAIASIAYGLPAPLVDGNVVRVFSRLRALGYDAKSPALAKACWSLATPAVHATRPGSYNQALMELGATVCTPKSPSCATCPVRPTGACAAWQEAVAVVQAAGQREGATRPPTPAPADIEDLTKEAGPAKKKQATLFAFSSFKTSSAPAPVPVAAAQPPALPPIPELPSLSPAQYAAATAHITAHYPLKAVKATSPTERLACALLVHRSDVGPRYLLVKKSSSLLAGQWAPYAVSLGRVEGEGDGEEEGDGVEVVEEEEGAAKGKGKGKAAGKRGRATIATDACPIPPPSLSPQQALLHGLATDVGLTCTPSSTVACSPFTHVFSHVVHEVEVQRWEVTLPVPSPSSTPAAGPGAGAGAGGIAAVEHKWCTLDELEGLGLTTWTVKALHASLHPEYSAWKASSSGSGARAGAGAEAGAEAGAGDVWPSLVARWKKAGCSL